jgi:hypothetical protein
MIIQEKIGDITIQVGEPSKNHVRFSKEFGFGKDTTTHTIEFHYSNWMEVKNLVDKMFKMTDEIK